MHVLFCFAYTATLRQLPVTTRLCPDFISQSVTLVILVQSLVDPYCLFIILFVHTVCSSRPLSFSIMDYTTVVCFYQFGHLDYALLVVYCQALRRRLFSSVAMLAQTFLYLLPERLLFSMFSSFCTLFVLPEYKT